MGDDLAEHVGRHIADARQGAHGSDHLLADGVDLRLGRIAEFDVEGDVVPSILTFFRALPATKSLPVLGSTAADSAVLICCSVRLMETPGWDGTAGKYPSDFVQYTRNRRRESALDGIESITLPIDRSQHQAAFAGQAELLAQAAGVGIDGARIDIAIARPDPGSNSSRDSTRPMLRNRITASSNSRWVRSTSLRPGEYGALPRSISMPPNWSVLDPRLSPAQQGMDARHELHVADRLGNIVIGAHAQDIGSSLFIGAGGTENHRHIPANCSRTCLSTSIAAHVGQIPVDDEKIETAALQALPGRPAIGKNLDLMPLALQQRLQHLGLASLSSTTAKIIDPPISREFCA
jgi:hypothetical protein